MAERRQVSGGVRGWPPNAAEKQTQVASLEGREEGKGARGWGRARKGLGLVSPF